MISLRLAVFVAIIVHHFSNHDVWLKRLYGANAEDVPTTEEKKTKSRIESVIEALRQVADVEKQLRENKGCDKVDLLNITFDERRWKKEALLTVQVANLMTSLWRSPGENGYPVAANDALLYDFVRSIVLFSPPVFGSVICFDNYLYKNYTRFCPYAFRDPGLNGSVHVIDIVSASDGYDYTTDHNAIWWHQPKRKARSFTPARVTSLYQTRFNTTATDLPRKRTFPHVTFENGTWTRPYFDCFGGKVWMVTYLAPFYNETDDFLGVVSIDVVLSDIDINQCDNQDSSESVDGEKNGIDYTPGDLMEFMGTHLCKKSTKCEKITNEGFKRGSYICTCKRGYYFPDSRAPVKAFNGTAIELEHDRMLRGEPNAYEDDSFECIRCSVGCDECVDDSPCVYSLKVEIRLTLCVLNGFVMGVTIVFAVYVAINWKDKIFKASSPKFMEVILLGAMLMYSTLVVSYFEPNTISCISRPWLRHIGFALVYGPLALKTWRVALIFRVRSAQKLALSDGVLLKRLFLLVILYSSYLTVWTVMQPPSVETAMTSDDLKYQRCVENWFDLTVIFGDIVVLIWGMWLCYKIRNAPAAYNESKYISWAIYNAMFVTSFLMVVRVTTKGNSNPDLMYALDFLLIHMNCSIVLILMFIHKFLLVRQMQRTVNNAISSHNNMLVTEDEVVVDRAAYQQEELLRKENQALKEEVRRLGEKLAALKSRLMTDGNHPVHKASSRAGSVRRKSACAFTLPHKEPGTVLETKRHSLQLPPTLKNSTHDAGQSTAWTANPMPELNETHDVTYPQELDLAASLLHSVCVHSRKLSQQSEKS